eukprot:s2212_g5.t1
MWCCILIWFISLCAPHWDHWGTAVACMQLVRSSFLAASSDELLPISPPGVRDFNGFSSEEESSQQSTTIQVSHQAEGLQGVSVAQIRLRAVSLTPHAHEAGRCHGRVVDL